MKKSRKQRKIELNLKKQSQNRPLAGNPKLEFRNPKRVERVHLKKQSQFIRIEYCVMRIAKTNLKKQSQFAGGLNWRKVFYERRIWQNIG